MSILANLHVERDAIDYVASVHSQLAREGISSDHTYEAICLTSQIYDSHGNPTSHAVQAQNFLPVVMRIPTRQSRLAPSSFQESLQ